MTIQAENNVELYHKCKAVCKLLEDMEIERRNFLSLAGVNFLELGDVGIAIDNNQEVFHHDKIQNWLIIHDEQLRIGLGKYITDQSEKQSLSGINHI